MEHLKFKVGDKVHIKVWNDMPLEVVDNWGEPSYINETGIIIRHNPQGYDVSFPSLPKCGFRDPPEAFYLPQELELVVKIGEQLLFDFAKE